MIYYRMPIVRLLQMLAVIIVVTTSAFTSDTLTFVNEANSSERHLTLRRNHDRLTISDDRSRRILVSGAAAATTRVVIRGARDHNDTLTIDLSQPLSLSGGVDYDGGDAGWDTLVLKSGAVHNEVVTQLSPRDGVFDLDGLIIRYTNLEPITDTSSALNLTVNGTLGTDTVTIADGPAAGQATISSPTFESFTFANKTNVIFDGLGGNDSVVLNNPSPATGLVNFQLRNIATVTQTALIAYDRFGVNATGAVTLNNAGNDVNNLEITSQNGAIDFGDADAIVIGGVDASLIGLNVVSTGDVSLRAAGTITLADADGPQVIHSGNASGNVTVRATGAMSNVIVTRQARRDCTGWGCDVHKLARRASGNRGAEFQQRRPCECQHPDAGGQ